MDGDRVLNPVKETMKMLLSDEIGVTAPVWFNDMFDYLFDKNQIVFFIDNNELIGYVCFWRYGKRRFRWIKNGLVNIDSNPLYMTQGEYVYMPVSVVKKEKAEGFLDRSVHSIKRLIPNVKEISYHASNGQFIRIRMED